MNIQKRTAQILLDIKAVHFNAQDPYTLTSGRKSPVYIDCRKIISFPAERRELMGFAADILKKIPGTDVIAGGETAGISYAAWISELLNLPMVYVRKKPKDFGRMAQIEGAFTCEKPKTILVEDLTSDGQSKVTFANVLRTAGAEISDVFSIFFYGIFPETENILRQAGLRLHYLATWQDVLAEARAQKSFDDFTLGEVERFINDPLNWAPQGPARKELS